jgi:hypothetical protein
LRCQLHKIIYNATRPGPTSPTATMNSTKNTNQHPDLTNETTALAMADNSNNSLREKVGFVKFVTLSSSSPLSSSPGVSCWPAVIFDDLEDYKRQRENLQKLLGNNNKTSIIDADTAINKHRTQLLQAGQRLNNNKQQPVAFLLGSSQLLFPLLQKKRLIFEDDNNVLKFIKTFDENNSRWEEDTSTDTTTSTATTAASASGAFQEAAVILSSSTSGVDVGGDCQGTQSLSSLNISPLSSSDSAKFDVDQKNEPEFSVKRLCFFNIVVKVAAENNDDGTTNNECIIPWPAILIRDMSSFPEAISKQKLQILLKQKKASHERRRRTTTTISNRITLTNVLTDGDDDESKRIDRIKTTEIGLLWKDVVMILSSDDCSTGIFLFGNPPPNIMSTTTTKEKKIIPYNEDKVTPGTAIAFTDIARYCNVISGYQEAVSESTLFSIDPTLLSMINGGMNSSSLGETNNVSSSNDNNDSEWENGDWCWLKEGSDSSESPHHADSNESKAGKRKKKSSNTTKVFRDLSNVATKTTTKPHTKKPIKKRKTSNSSTDNSSVDNSRLGILCKQPSLLERIFRSRDIKEIPDFDGNVRLALEEAGHAIDITNSTYIIPGGEGIFHSIDEYRSYLCINGVALRGIKDRSAKKEDRFQALMAWVCYHRVEKLVGGKDVSEIAYRIDTSGLQKMLLKLGMMYRSYKWEIPGSDDRYDENELEDKLAKEGIDQVLVANSEMSNEEHICLELYISCPFLRSTRNNTTPFFKAA